MTHKLTVTVETTPVEAPKGITAGLLRISVTDTATGVVSFEKDVEGVVADFEGVADGEYLISVARLDSNGLLIGSAVSQRFVVSVEPVVMYDAPVGFTVTATPE